jgi:DNA gyrase subunit A
MSNPEGAGNVKLEEFGAILERAFVTYGLSVVTDRALPDARDGLKPVQRRILYCMWANRYLSTRPTVKSAEVVGKVLGDYHPHSDSAVYDAAVRLAQEFSMRYPLVEGQGNFGSIDDDPAAAYRYTEMRLSLLGELMLRDIDRETVPLKPSYKQDPKVVEPDYLPARIPPVCNPSSGIAVGLATNIPPHNLAEVLSACLALFDHPQMPVHELMQYVRGPDFPGGGIVVGEDGVREYLATGKGRVVVRGAVKLEENGRQRSLVVTEVPPLSKARLKASIVKAVNDRRLDGLVPEVKDESDTEKGIRIVLDVKRDANPVQMLNALYRYTDLQIAISVQMVYLFGASWAPARQPRQAGMVEILCHYNEHQVDVVRRRATYDLRGARERLHVVEGLIVGAANATEVVRIFQGAADRAEAKNAIREQYTLSEAQAETIASMTLAQVTRLDAAKFAEEQRTLVARIAELETLLASPALQVEAVRAEMRETLATLGDARRTVIDVAGDPTIDVTEVVPSIENHPVTVVLGTDGTVKVCPRETYRRPGARDYPMLTLLLAETVNSLLVVTDTGRVFGLRVQDLPQGTRASRGEVIRKLARLDANETPIVAVVVPSFEPDPDDATAPSTLVLVTAQGRIKRSALSEYRGVGAGGVVDFKVASNDKVVAAFVASTADDLIIVTSDARVLRMTGTELRSTGRGTQGVLGIGLSDGARVVGAGARPGGEPRAAALFTLSTEGVGKRSAIADIPSKGRATGGVLVAPNGTTLVAATVQGHDSSVLLRTAGQVVVRLGPREIPLQARGGRGVVLVPTAPLDPVIGAVPLPAGA